jgi:hypothetical protein
MLRERTLELLRSMVIDPICPFRLKPRLRMITIAFFRQLIQYRTTDAVLHHAMGSRDVVSVPKKSRNH